MGGIIQKAANNVNVPREFSQSATIGVIEGCQEKYEEAKQKSFMMRVGEKLYCCSPCLSQLNIREGCKNFCSCCGRLIGYWDKKKRKNSDDGPGQKREPSHLRPSDPTHELITEQMTCDITEISEEPTVIKKTEKNSKVSQVLSQNNQDEFEKFKVQIN